MPELPVSAETWGLATVALDYGAHVAAETRETSQPALVAETPEGETQITQLVLLEEEAASAPLRAALSNLADQADAVRGAVVLDGNTHIEGVTEDAILVLVGERGQAQAHEFAQRYRRSGLRKKFQLV